ncbi:MAG TPA: fatty acid desaturase [Polyangiaceae bacterium]
MRPRYAADYRTLLWALFMPVFGIAQYARPDLILYFCPLACYFALSAGVIAHNHNHCPTFKSRRMNHVFGCWLSVFYGYPTFGWIPTHNLNHHKLVNKAGDATITWRYTNRHNALVASTYFFVSAYFQSEPIKAYIRKARRDNRALYRQIIGQYAVWAGAHALLIAAAIAKFGIVRGIEVWIFAFGLPAFFALWTIMLFNYIQHVHTDPWSAHNHSRSFTGKAINFLLFNNGLHAAHHEQAGAHWSTLPALHAKIQAEIHPELKPRSFWWFCLRVYVLALFMPRFGTRQIGRAPFDCPTGDAGPLKTADVDAVDSGVNAAMA